MWTVIFFIGFAVALYKTTQEPVFAAMFAAYVYFAIPMEEYFAPDLRYQLVFNVLALLTCWRYKDMRTGWSLNALSDASKNSIRAATAAAEEPLKTSLVQSAAEGESLEDIRYAALEKTEVAARQTVLQTAPTAARALVDSAVERALEAAAFVGARAAVDARQTVSAGSPQGVLRAVLGRRVHPAVEHALHERTDATPQTQTATRDESQETKSSDEEIPVVRGPLAGLIGNGGVWLHIVFVLLTLFGALRAVLNPDAAWARVDHAWKLLIPMCAIVCAVRTDRHFRLFTIAWMFGVWHLSMDAITFWLQYGGRADEIGGQGGEANFLGAIVVTVAPITFGIFLTRQPTWIKAVVGGVACCYGLGILACGSRGAMIAFTLGAGYWLVHTSRKMVAFGLALCAAAAFMVVAPESFWQRLGTVLEPKDDNPYVRPFEESSKGSRKVLWQLAIDLFKENPSFGIGPSQFAAVSAEKTEFTGAYSGQRGLETHNSWLQLLCEYGAIGLTVWAGAFIFSMWCYRRARALLADYDSHDWFRAICLGFEAGAVGNAVAITFQSFQWYDYMYWHFAFGPLALTIARDTKKRLDWLKPEHSFRTADRAHNLG